jgi:hypothetical protein
MSAKRSLASLEAINVRPPAIRGDVYLPFLSLSSLPLTPLFSFFLNLFKNCAPRRHYYTDPHSLHHHLIGQPVWSPLLFLLRLSSLETDISDLLVTLEPNRNILNFRNGSPSLLPLLLSVTQAISSFLFCFSPAIPVLPLSNALYMNCIKC